MWSFRLAWWPVLPVCPVREKAHLWTRSSINVWQETWTVQGPFRADTKASRDWNSWIRWSTSTSLRSGGLRDPIRQPIPEYLTWSGICLQQHRMQKQEAIRKEDSVLTSKEDDVRPAAEMESSRSRCISCRMSMFRVKYVREDVTTERHWKWNTKERISMMF